MCGAGVTQTMWAIVWQAATKCANVNGDSLAGARRDYRPIRFLKRKKKRASGNLRANLSQIFQNCIPYLGDEWKFLDSLVLRTTHAHLILGPVQVIKRQLADLPNPQTIHRQ